MLRLDKGFIFAVMKKKKKKMFSKMQNSGEGEWFKWIHLVGNATSQNKNIPR